jgi:hypothetical protein
VTPASVVDPYSIQGSYRKAQLHCHTTNSDGTLAPRELLERYRAAGYTFVVFTDHERVTSCDDLNDGTFLAVPGVETATGRPFRPLGPHLGRLGVPGPLGQRGAQAAINATVAAGGVVSLHHPGWNGNLRTGRWSVAEMATLRGYHLIEISNHHSANRSDVEAWTRVLVRRGSAAAVSGVAVDDLHRDRDFNTGWVTVKTADVTPEALLLALRRGAVVASTGPEAEFGVRDGAIVCATDAGRIRFLDAHGAVRYDAPGPEAAYAADGTEGFVRVECLAAAGRTAWSQAFWIADDRLASRAVVCVAPTRRV